MEIGFSTFDHEEEKRTTMKRLLNPPPSAVGCFLGAHPVIALSSSLVDVPGALRDHRLSFTPGKYRDDLNFPSVHGIF